LADIRPQSSHNVLKEQSKEGFNTEIPRPRRPVRRIPPVSAFPPLDYDPNYTKKTLTVEENGSGLHSSLQYSTEHAYDSGYEGSGVGVTDSNRVEASGKPNYGQQYYRRDRGDRERPPISYKPLRPDQSLRP
jgi:hypothetical protein